jgi:hypothetical protein
VRDVYLTEQIGETRVPLKKAVVSYKSNDVAEIRSLGETLKRWQQQILSDRPAPARPSFSCSTLAEASVAARIRTRSQLLTPEPVTFIQAARTVQ